MLDGLVFKRKRNWVSSLFCAWTRRAAPGLQQQEQMELCNLAGLQMGTQRWGDPSKEKKSPQFWA